MEARRQAKQATTVAAVDSQVDPLGSFAAQSGAPLEAKY